MLPLLKYAALGELRVLDAEKQLAGEFGLRQRSEINSCRTETNVCSITAHIGPSSI